MNRNRKITAVVVAALVGVGALGFSAAAVDDAKEVRAADFIGALADTRSAGHVDFLEEGLHVYTDDASSNAKAAQYFAPRGGNAIPETASQDWYGTTPEPGKQIVFDYDGIDGNSNDYNILVGEPVYGDNWWLTNGSSADAKAADPSGANDGGNGSAYFGTLAQWKAAMPNARVLAYGFSLGSGVKGDGVLRAQTYGGAEYIFTDEENPAAVTPESHGPNDLRSTLTHKPVTGAPEYAFANKKTDITFRSSNAPANDAQDGAKITWRVTVDNVGKFSAVLGWGASAHYVDIYPASDPNHVVRTYKNGTLVNTKTVTTN